MLFVEFIAPAKNSTQALKCLCALYYLKYNLSIDIASVAQIKNLLKRARIMGRRNRVNFFRALESLDEKVDSPTKGLWQITPSGEKKVKDLLSLTDENVEVENDTTTLEKIINTKLKDPAIKDYFQEGIDCLKIGRLRACIVFLWAGSTYVIREELLTKPAKQLNAAIQKYDKKARNVTKIDDFAYIKDSILLLAAQELGLYDKSQRDALEQCLDLRNKCGHPGKYSPGPKRVSSYIEDLVSIIFS